MCKQLGADPRIRRSGCGSFDGTAAPISSVAAESVRRIRPGGSGIRSELGPRPGRPCHHLTPLAHSWIELRRLPPHPDCEVGSHRWWSRRRSRASRTSGSRCRRCVRRLMISPTSRSSVAGARQPLRDRRLGARTVPAIPVRRPARGDATGDDRGRGRERWRHREPGQVALTYVEMALVRADRLTATERAMASTVRGRPGRTHGGFS